MSDRRSRSESMSTAPAAAKLAMFQKMGEAKAAPELVKPSARIKDTVSAVGVMRCMNTRHDVKPGRGRKFDKKRRGPPGEEEPDRPALSVRAFARVCFHVGAPNPMRPTACNPVPLAH